MAPRSWRILRNAALAFGAAVLVGLASGGLLAIGGEASRVGLAVAMILLSAAAIAACLPWWRSVDDAARDAHKTAWWWGGCFGALAGVMCLAVFAGTRSPFMAGAVLVVAAEVAAYAVVWAGWWWARRSPLAA